MSSPLCGVRIGSIVATCAILMVATARAQDPAPAPTDSSGIHPVGPASAAPETLGSPPPPTLSPPPIPEAESSGLPTLRELPEYSAELDLPGRLLSPDPSASLGTWYTSVERALQRAGIGNSRTFLLANDGIAVMTPFQRIDENGKRCGSSQDSCGECGSFWARIWSRPPCHYRSFVFALSRSLPQSAPTPATRHALEQLQQSGMSGVPLASLQELPTRGLTAKVFVCEYECDEAREDVTFIPSSLISALDHVTKAKIWKASEVQRAR